MLLFQKSSGHNQKQHEKAKSLKKTGHTTLFFVNTGIEMNVKLAPCKIYSYGVVFKQEF